MAMSVLKYVRLPITLPTLGLVSCTILPIYVRDFVPCLAFKNVHSGFLSLLVFLDVQSNSWLESYVQVKVDTL